MVADFGVHGVGEVDRRRALDQGDDPALGREDVDLVLTEVELERFEEGDRVVLLLFDVGEALHPGDLFVRGALFVAPVRGHAELGPSVHLEGPDLHLDRFAPGSDHRGVQRLVQVELGRVDVVLETSGDRGPQRVNGADHRPAVTILIDDDAQPHQVEDVVELLAADDHLLVDAPEVLRASADLGLDAELVELGRERRHDLAEVVLALGLTRRHHLLDLGVALRVQRREAKVLELPLDLLDAESVGQRRVDVERLLGDGALTGHRHDRDRAHVVQAVGQLDQQYPPVLGHGDEHLADGGGLLLFLGIELQTVELGDAVHDRGDLIPEFFGHPLLRDAGVFDGVVQQRRRDGGLVQSQVGGDIGDGDRVGDVGLAGSAKLALVGLDGGRAGASNDLDVAVGVVLEESPDEAINGPGQRGVSRGARSETDHGVSLMAAYRRFCLRARA